VVFLHFSIFCFFTLGRFNLHSHQITSICIFRYILVELIFTISFLDLQIFALFLVSVNRSQSFRITVDSENRFFTSPGTTFTFFITIFLVFPLAHRTFPLYFLMWVMDDADPFTVSILMSLHFSKLYIPSVDDFIWHVAPVSPIHISESSLCVQ